jgi:hypothetical protein
MWFSPKNYLPKEPVAVFNHRTQAEEYILTKNNPEEYKVFKSKHKDMFIIKEPKKLKKTKFQSRSHRRYNPKAKNK